ncbi:MAG TPA: hypothetical protein VHM92_08380 [Allosphingosinicella sp.]|nr:hypothetical protein [Allosphingosinicella sp.]
MPFLIAVGALAALAGGAPAQAEVATVDVATATRTFSDICLAHSGSADEARRAAEAAGFTKGDTLPGLMGGAPLETWNKPPLDIGIRARRGGDSSCILIFAPEHEVDNAAVAAAVGAIPGLAPKSSKGSAKSWRATWTPLKAPKGSKVYLTIGSGIGHRSAILTLEAKPRK